MFDFKHIVHEPEIIRSYLLDNRQLRIDLRDTDLLRQHLTDIYQLILQMREQRRPIHVLQDQVIHEVIEAFRRLILIFDMHERCDFPDQLRLHLIRDKLIHLQVLIVFHIFEMRMHRHQIGIQRTHEPLAVGHQLLPPRLKSRLCIRFCLHMLCQRDLLYEDQFRQ